MKKYTLTLLFLTMFALAFQNAYATSEFIAEDVENEVTLNGSIYEDGIEVKETGTVTTLRFYANYANGEAAYPVSGVKIEVLYNTETGKLRNLKTLGGYEGLEFVSDERGEIKIENLPYGLYKYSISEAPSGLAFAKDEDVTFEVTPFDYEVEKECKLNITITTAGKAYLFEPGQDIRIGTNPPIGYYDPKPTYETMGTGTGTTTQAQTEDVTLDNSDKATGAANNTTEVETTTTTTQEEYNPSVAQVEVLGNLYESAKTDFKVKEDAETEVDIENIPLSATIPVRVEMSKKDVIRAMRQTRITEQIRIATTNMDSTLSELYRLSSVTDDKKR